MPNAPFTTPSRCFRPPGEPITNWGASTSARTSRSRRLGELEAAVRTESAHRPQRHPADDRSVQRRAAEFRRRRRCVLGARRDSSQRSGGTRISRLHSIRGSNGLDEALAEFVIVLMLKPDSANAYVTMSQLELRRGEYAVAVDAARQAVNRDPANKQARYALAHGADPARQTRRGDAGVRGVRAAAARRDRRLCAPVDTERTQAGGFAPIGQRRVRAGGRVASQSARPGARRRLVAPRTRRSASQIWPTSRSG